jgi:hypothetical protein
MSINYKEFYFVCSSEEELKSFSAFHKPFVFLITLLASLVGGLFYNHTTKSTIPYSGGFVWFLGLLLVSYSLQYSFLSSGFHNQFMHNPS